MQGPRPRITHTNGNPATLDPAVDSRQTKAGTSGSRRGRGPHVPLAASVSRNDDTERGGGLGTPLLALLFAAVEKVVASAIGGTPKDDQADEQEYAGS